MSTESSYIVDNMVVHLVAEVQKEVGHMKNELVLNEGVSISDIRYIYSKVLGILAKMAMIDNQTNNSPRSSDRTGRDLYESLAELPNISIEELNSVTSIVTSNQDTDIKALAKTVNTLSKVANAIHSICTESALYSTEEYRKANRHSDIVELLTHLDIVGRLRENLLKEVEHDMVDAREFYYCITNLLYAIAEFERILPPDRRSSSSNSILLMGLIEKDIVTFREDIRTRIITLHIGLKGKGLTRVPVEEVYILTDLLGDTYKLYTQRGIINEQMIESVALSLQE